MNWAERLKGLYGGPPEFKIFEVAGYRFKVPYPFSRGFTKSNNVFQLAPYWPTLDPYGSDKPQPRHLEVFDTLQVTVKQYDGFERRQRYTRRNIAQVKQAKADPNVEIDWAAGLVRILGSPIFVALERIKLGHVQQYFQVICDSKACTMSYMPFDRIEVRIVYDRPLLSDWRVIIRRINDMLKEFKE